MAARYPARARTVRILATSCVTPIASPARTSAASMAFAARVPYCSTTSLYARASPLPPVAGADIVTVEGYQDDAVMAELRAAFNRHHALQCGFCTPGMLATARDIVLRLPGADEATIRHELSGNLCRCTGYMGIVAAIRSVLDARRSAQSDPAPSVPAVGSARAFTSFAVADEALGTAPLQAAPAANDAGAPRTGRAGRASKAALLCRMPSTPYGNSWPTCPR